jgi:hypothetical protein
VLGCHEEVARLGRVVRRLFGDVVALGAVRVVPVTCEDLTQDGVERLLDSPNSHQLLLMGAGTQWICIRGLDMPTTQVKLCHCYESLHWVVDLGNGEECLGVCHKATQRSALRHDHT